MTRRAAASSDLPEPGIASLTWAAKQLKISVSTARTRAKNDELPGAFQIGTSWRVATKVFWEEVEALARSKANHPSATGLAPVAPIHPVADGPSLVRRPRRDDVS